MHRLFIGSRNDMHRISAADEVLILATLSARIPSYTYHRAIGIFNGQKEETLIVYVASVEFLVIQSIARELRRELEQEGIGVEHNCEYVRIVD